MTACNVQTRHITRADAPKPKAGERQTWPGRYPAAAKNRGACSRCGEQIEFGQLYTFARRQVRKDETATTRVWFHGREWPGVEERWHAGCTYLGGRRVTMLLRAAFVLGFEGRRPSWRETMAGRPRREHLTECAFRVHGDGHDCTCLDYYPEG